METKASTSDMGTFSQKQISILLGVMLTAGFIVRVWGIWFGLPDILHGDEPEVLNHAMRFGSGDFNPHRFQYGSLTQYMLFALYGLYFLAGRAIGLFDSLNQFAVAFVDDPTVFYLIARGLSALFGTATIALVYLIGRQVKSAAAGLLAAMLLACCYSHAVHSHYGTVDITMTFFCTLATLQCLQLFACASLRRYLLAGFCLGLAIAAKFSGSLFVTALIAAHFLRPDRRPLRAKLFCPKLYLGIAAVFAGHFAGCPFFYIDLNAALGEAAQLSAMHATEQFNFLPYVKMITAQYWGGALGLLCLLGAATAAFSGNRKLYVLIITALIALLFAAAHKFVEAKYILYCYPLLAVLGGWLCRQALCIFPKKYALLLTALLITHPLQLIIAHDISLSSKSLSTQAREWIEQHIPAGSKILLDGGGRHGIRIANAPANLERQYARALRHGLLKAEYLKLKLQAPAPKTYYDIVLIADDAGFRADDYQRYRLWQDLEYPGFPPAYYRERGFDYVVITGRYFKQIAEGFELIKEMNAGDQQIRIYRVPRKPSP